MSDVLIRIIVDSKGAAAGAAQFDNASKKIRRTAAATEKAVGKNSQAFFALQKAVRLVDGPLGGVAARFETLNSVSKGAERSILGLVAAVAVLGTGITTLVRSGDQFVALQNKLRLVTKSTQELNSVQEELFRISQDTRNSFDAVATLYSRLARNAGQYGITNKQVASTVELVSKATATLGGNAQSTQAALFQLSQGLAANRLSGQELNSILEQATPISTALEAGLKKLGFEFTSLKDFAADGNITFANFIRAIEASRDSIEGGFSTAVLTLGQSFMQLKNSILQYVGGASSGLKITQGLASGVSLLALNLDTVLTYAVSLAVASLAGLAINLALAGSSMTALAVATLGLSKAFAFLVATPVGAFMTAIGLSIAYVIDQSGSLSGAFLVLRGVMAQGFGAIVKGASYMAIGVISSIDPIIKAFIDLAKVIASIGTELTKLNTRVLSGRFSDIGSDLNNALTQGFAGGMTETGRQMIAFLAETIDGVDIATQELLDGYTARIAESMGDITPDPQSGVKTPMTTLVEDTKKKKKALKYELTAVEKIFERTAENITDAFTDTFKDLFRGNIDGFKGFVDRIKDLFTDMLAQMATLAIARPIIIPMVQSLGGFMGVGGEAMGKVTGQLGGGTGMPSVGGFGNLTSLAGGLNTPLFDPNGFVGGSIDKAGSFFGIGGTGVQGPTPGGAPLGGASGNFTAGAAVAGMVGNFGANLAFGGDRGVGASIGGAVGGFGGTLATPAIKAALLGTPLAPIAPLIGPLVGSFLGNAVGGLFGGKKSSDISQLYAETGDFGLTESRTAGKNIGTEFADGLTEGLGTITQSLNSVSGLGVGGLSIFGGRNNEKGFFDIGRVGQEGNLSSINFDPTNEDSVNTGLAQLTLELARLGTATGPLLIEALKNINTEGRSFEEVLGDIQFASTLDTLSFLEPITSQAAQAISALNTQTEEYLAKARELFKDTEALTSAENKLTDARDRQFMAIRGGFNAGINSQILAINNPEASALQSLQAEFAPIIREAIATGGDLAGVEELFGLRRKQILEDILGEQEDILGEQEDSLKQLRDRLKEYLLDIQKIRDSLALNSQLGGLNRLGRATEAQNIFGRLSSRVQSGDITALQDLQSTTQDYLNASLDYYGPTEEYLKRLEDVYKLLDMADQLARDSVSVEERALQEQQTTNSLLQQLIEATATPLSDFGFGTSVSMGQLLRPGEDDSVLDRTSALSGLQLRVDRALKVQASGGAFSFGSSQGTFADFVKTNPQAGIAYLGALETALADSGNLGGILEQQRDIFGFASGTGNGAFGGGLAMVGENGPELVNFSRPAQIVTSGNTDMLMGAETMAKEFVAYRAQSAKETQYLGEQIDRLNAQVEELTAAMKNIALRSTVV